jgi:hypothetical protein
MKQFRLLLLSFLVGFLNLPLCATVEPITAGESLWKLVSRIGVTSDSIESKLCLLDYPCDVLIFQDDVAPGGIGGGTYEITGTGGVYCLAGLTEFTVGPAIAISGSNITLDLRGFVLNGQPFGGPQASNAILLKADASNITIKNGTIAQTINGIEDEGLDIQHREIVIDGIRFIHGSGVAISLDFNASIPDVDHILIQNCMFDSTRAANIQCLTTRIRACSVNGAAAFHPEGFFISGAGVTPAESVLLEDCFIDGTKAFVLEVTNANKATVRRLTKAGDLSTTTFFDILFDSVDDVILTDLILASAVLVSGTLVRIENPLRVYVSRCFGVTLIGGFLRVQSGPRNICGVEIVGCRGQVSGGAAFEFIATGTSVFQNIIVRDCFAYQGVISLSGDAGSRFSNVLFDHCSALLNGFSLQVRSGAFPILEHVEFRDCIALGSGFSFNSTEMMQDVIFQNCFAVSDNDATINPLVLNAFELGLTMTLGKVLNCYALGYTFTGFVNDAPTSANYFFGNTSVGNNPNFGGNGSLNPVLLNTGANEIAGGTPWTNASMP